MFGADTNNTVSMETETEPREGIGTAEEEETEQQQVEETAILPSEGEGIGTEDYSLSGLLMWLP